MFSFIQLETLDELQLGSFILSDSMDTVKNLETNLLTKNVSFKIN